MLLDIRRMFSRYDGPVHCEETVSMEGEDFPGYAVEGPAHAAFTAVLCGAVLELECRLQAAVRFECARCLVPCTREFPICETFSIREADLGSEEAELPFTPEGRLDTKELLYTELVLHVPGVLLCSEDCAGLCPVCGCRKPCSCKHETSGGAVDERLAILQQLLSE